MKAGPRETPRPAAGHATGRRTIYLTTRQLRFAAAAVRRTTGLRLELVTDAWDESPPSPPACPPPRCGKHAGVVQHIARALRGGLPPGRAVVEGVGVATESAFIDPAQTSGSRPERATATPYLLPDLTVCPARYLISDDALLHPQDVELAVEVVTPAARVVDPDPDPDGDPAPPSAGVENVTPDSDPIARAVAHYATAGVRTLLVIDPRPSRRRWILHTGPAVSGNYASILHGGFDHGLTADSPARCEAIPLPAPFGFAVSTRELLRYSP